MTTVIDTRAEPRPQPAVAAPPAPLPAAPGPTVRRLLGEQTVVLLGQGIAGLGNLAFLLVAVRLLPSSEFAELATFQALYLLLLMPTLGLSAGASAAPEAIGAAQRRTMYVAGALAVGFAAASLPIGAGLQLPWLLVILLGLTLPAAGPLALARGRLYGRARHLGVGASLVAEPAVRLGAGIPLMAAAGPVGGGLGVVLGSYAALALAWLAGRRRVARHSANLPVTTT
ncbi:MAG TPA: hypothetical protein VG708_15605, partial [Mycobacteriales bacterium]|nr:hypothetical protein [Mycobacteriales bacterium]